MVKAHSASHNSTQNVRMWTKWRRKGYVKIQLHAFQTWTLLHVQCYSWK